MQHRGSSESRATADSHSHCEVQGSRNEMGMSRQPSSRDVLLIWFVKLQERVKRVDSFVRDNINPSGPPQAQVPGTSMSSHRNQNHTPTQVEPSPQTPNMTPPYITTSSTPTLTPIIHPHRPQQSHQQPPQHPPPPIPHMRTNRTIHKTQHKRRPPYARCTHF